MPIIDFHAHIYPNKIAEKATNATADYYGILPACIGTGNDLLKEGKKAGIDEFVLLPVATKPGQVRHVNAFILEETAAHKEFHGFGTLHPDCENIMEEAEYILNLGLKGIKLHPDTQQFNTGLPLLVHCGDKRFDYSHPARLKKVIDNFRKLQVIAAHLGGWSLFEEAFAILRNKDCYLDISSCMMFLPPETVARYIAGYGADRILFGTDFPLWSPKTEVEAFQRLPLSAEDFDKIAYKNARRILRD